MTKHRTPTPIIQFLRDILRGRKVVPQLRYADVISARTQPPSEIPGGPYHKTTQIYYFTRDARREVEPPLEVSVANQILAGQEEKVKHKYLTPGQLSDWC